MAPDEGELPVARDVHRGEQQARAEARPARRRLPADRSPERLELAARHGMEARAKAGRVGRQQLPPVPPKEATEVRPWPSGAHGIRSPTNGVPRSSAASSELT